MTNRIFDSVLVTGGAGYCGSQLIPQLLASGFRVTVYDILYFGDSHLPKANPNLKVIRGDIRDTAKLAAAMRGHDAVLHLACISNHASFELDESLSTSINYEAFGPMVRAAKAEGIKRFVYASSSSVYGVSDAPDVTEDHPLVPLTLYNKFKGLCEPILKAEAEDNFTVATFRPATVCGYAPRLRLDLSVNILTNHAVTNNKIIVFGGGQLRPNLHVKDYADVCELLLGAPHEKVHREIFNVGSQNMSIKEISSVVKQVVQEEFPEKQTIEIETTESNDNRSYHINSEKIYRALGFRPKHSVQDAVRSLCAAFREGKIPDSMNDDRYYNIRTMRKLEAR